MQKEKRTLGCDDVLIDTRHRAVGFKFRTCIGNFFNEEALGWIEAQEKFEQGVMPFPGSYMEQPSKVLDVFRVIKNFKIEKEIEQIKKTKNGRRENNSPVRRPR